jgi:3-hydroxyisobutyrate dehydrogenase
MKSSGFFFGGILNTSMWRRGDKMKIGWIGLGNMGTPMVHNLHKEGFSVYVYNRTTEKTNPLTQEGAVAVSRAEELVSLCDVIVTMVSDDEAVRALYVSKDSFLRSDSQVKLCIDMSTVSPDTSILVSKRCKELGIAFLDAPVSGSVQPAKEGKLLVLVGGERSKHEQAKPIFDVLGKRSFYLGPNGSGSKAKLAINLLLALTVQGLAETTLFAEHMGIDKEDMLSIIHESAVGTPIAKMKNKTILSGNYPAAFALKHMAKDLRLASQQGASVFPLAKTATESYQEALSNWGDQDVMAILPYIESTVHTTV